MSTPRAFECYYFKIILNWWHSPFKPHTWEIIYRTKSLLLDQIRYRQLSLFLYRLTLYRSNPIFDIENLPFKYAHVPVHVHVRHVHVRPVHVHVRAHFACLCPCRYRCTVACICPLPTRPCPCNMNMNMNMHMHMGMGMGLGMNKDMDIQKWGSKIST